MRELAVWRAASGVKSSDQRPTGDPADTASEAAVQRQLDERVRTHLTGTTTDDNRWAERLQGAAVNLDEDPFWPVLLERLTSHRLNGPAADYLVDATTGAPLPDELPAAALYWRIVEHFPAGVELDWPTRTDRAVHLDPRAAHPVEQPGDLTAAVPKYRPPLGPTSTEPLHPRPPRARPPTPNRPPIAPHRGR